MHLVIRIGVLLLAMSPLACSAAESQTFKAGEHYYAVGKSHPPADSEKIEVAEVFWYGCPHCYKFDAYVERWDTTRPGDVVLRRLPSSLGRPIGILHSKAFYTAENLGILEQFHPTFFAAIHDEHQAMSNVNAIGAVFARLGIEKSEFEGNFNGFAVDNRVRRAETMVRDFRISSVPSMVVDGRWFTNATLAGGSYDKMLKVVDHLIVKARQERGK